MTDIDNLIKELKFDLESESEESRRHALLSLLNLPVNEAVINLVESVLEKDSSDQNRYIARKFLASVNSSKREEVLSVQTDTPQRLLDKGWRGGNREEKIQAVQLIMKGEHRECLGAIVSRLREEDDNWVVASLIKAVGYLGTSSQVPVIQPYLEHSDPRVQANAVEALEAIGDSLVVALLLPMLKKKDHRVRANAVKAIYRYDREEAFAVIRELAVSEKAWHRDGSLHCISVLEDDSLYPLVLDMYQSELDVPLRKKEKEFLQKVGIHIPEVRSCDSALLSDEDSALLDGDVTTGLGDGIVTGINVMSLDEVDRRVKKLLSKKDEVPSFFSRLTNITPLIVLGVASLVLLMTGYALFFGGHGSLNTIVKAVKTQLSPFSERGCPYKGETIKFRGSVLKHEGKPEELLIESDNRRILCSFDGPVPNGIKAGVKVSGSCEITGKTRFGSIYGKVIDITKL
jgi:HEAT repeat protein